MPRKAKDWFPNDRATHEWLDATKKTTRATYQTAWKIGEGLPCAKDISMAKAWTGEAYRNACVEAIQIHGGIGITKDHDVQLYYRRAKAMEIAFGDADYHLELVAREMGL